jgi:hypothetical protein
MFSFLRRWFVKKDYTQTPVPGNCPVCRLGVLSIRIVRLAVLDWKTMRPRWCCHHCNSFFTWDASDRIVANIETHFPRGLLGNVDVEAITKANSGDTILITGKGTDPYIMRANGEREIWSDSRVAREELEKFLATK